MSGITGRAAKEQLTVNDIRYHNKVNLFSDIVKSKGITRNDLAMKNNISIMTVKNIVDELLNMNLVEEHQLNSAFGRKPMGLWVASRFGNIICINLSSIDEIRFVIYDLRGESLASGRTRFKNRQKALREKLDVVISEIREKLSDIDNETVGVAVFVPGVYYEDQDIVRFAMFEELSEVKIKKIFSEAFGVNNIRVLHDTHASANSEYELRSEKNDSQFYLYCGDGVGSCLTNSDGSPVLGRDLLAGEIGNLIYTWHEDKTPVRIESLLSIAEIMKRLPEAYQDMEFEEVLKANKKDPEVTSVLEEVLQAAAQMMYNIVWIFNPSRIIVDSYCKQYAELIVCRTKAFFRQYFEEEFLQETEIAVTKCDEYHTMSGCMRHARASWIEQIVVSSENNFELVPERKEGIV